MDIPYGHWLDLKLVVSDQIDKTFSKSPDKLLEALRKIMKKMNDIESLTLDDYTITGENK